MNGLNFLVNVPFVSDFAYQMVDIEYYMYEVNKQDASGHSCIVETWFPALDEKVNELVESVPNRTSVLFRADVLFRLEMSNDFIS